MKPSDISWKIAPDAQQFVSVLARELGAEYGTQVAALREFICEYIVSRPKCDASQGDSINPIGGDSDFPKMLKVRWLVPGRGKSSGLRMILGARCKQRQITLRVIKWRVDL